MTPLQQKLEQLNLAIMSQQLEPTLTLAATRNLSVAQTLETLVDCELEARAQRCVERRFKLSRLHARPSIDSFQFNHHKSRLQLKNRILRLLDLDFLAQGTNVCLVGNPGVGKTFLAKIIGWRACQARQRVLFTTAMDMLNHLLTSPADHSLVPGGLGRQDGVAQAFERCAQKAAKFGGCPQPEEWSRRRRGRS